MVPIPESLAKIIGLAPRKGRGRPSGTSKREDDGHTVGSPGHDQWLLDEALAETFPASDPISPSTR